MSKTDTDQTVLVIEDDRSLASAINRKLNLSGFDTLSAGSVNEALALMEKNKPTDAIWLDHYLTGSKDGLDFVSATKSQEGWQSIPIYVVSNTASPDKVHAYNRLGVAHFYVKAEHRLEDIINDIKSRVTKR